jgi:hypothetical protein
MADHGHLGSPIVRNQCTRALDDNLVKETLPQVFSKCSQLRLLYDVIVCLFAIHYRLRYPKRTPRKVKLDLAKNGET